MNVLSCVNARVAKAVYTGARCIRGHVARYCAATNYSQPVLDVILQQAIHRIFASSATLVLAPVYVYTCKGY
jgi:hypothetical protein